MSSLDRAHGGGRIFLIEAELRKSVPFERARGEGTDSLIEAEVRESVPFKRARGEARRRGHCLW